MFCVKMEWQYWEDQDLLTGDLKGSSLMTALFQVEGCWLSFLARLEVAIDWRSLHLTFLAGDIMNRKGYEWVA